MGKCSYALIYLLCGISCTHQFFDILTRYLKYETTTKVAIILPEKIKAPDLSLCLPFKLIVDRDGLKTGMTLNISELKADYGINYLGHLTIKEIFELTPKIDYVLSGCLIRGNLSIYVVF